jgi:hypothetical protein
MKQTLLTCLILCLTIPGWSQQLTPLVRTYMKGEQNRYKLTCSSFQNGKWSSTTISEAKLTVGFDSVGVPYEEIQWLTCIMIKGKDTINQNDQASTVAPYRISLDPRGSMALPPLRLPAMTESITDFHTFFVAISPALGATKLQSVGDSYMKPQPAIGDFSNGKDIIKGQDCLQTKVTMNGQAADTVIVQSQFFPPLTTCLSYITPEMNTPVIADTVNNFQMLMPAGNGKYNVQYGREQFIIDSKVNKVNGKLLYASMHNELSLKLKIMCDQQYQACAAQMPLGIERRLTLELEP